MDTFVQQQVSCVILTLLCKHPDPVAQCVAERKIGDLAWNQPLPFELALSRITQASTFQVCQSIRQARFQNLIHWRYRRIERSDQRFGFLGESRSVVRRMKRPSRSNQLAARPPSGAKAKKQPNRKTNPCLIHHTFYIVSTALIFLAGSLSRSYSRLRWSHAPDVFPVPRATSWFIRRWTRNSHSRF